MPAKDDRLLSGIRRGIRLNGPVSRVYTRVVEREREIKEGGGKNGEFKEILAGRRRFGYH